MPAQNGRRRTLSKDPAPLTTSHPYLTDQPSGLASRFSRKFPMHSLTLLPTHFNAMLPHASSNSITTMKRHFDHIDLRVPRLADVAAFYEALLPALGFSRRVAIEGWLEFEAEGEGDAATEFFGITESPGHVSNENRVAFWAESPADVDRIAKAAASAGARNMEGPMEYHPGYRAAFFEDPCGNRLEVCHRTHAYNH